MPLQNFNFIKFLNVHALTTYKRTNEIRKPFKMIKDIVLITN